MPNPLQDNPLQLRGDLQNAVHTLFRPLIPHFSLGAARVKLGDTGAAYPMHIAELEGFARPLWGLAPLSAGGGEFQHWDMYQRGLAHGTDPDHPEYWGNVSDYDQRFVEMTPLALTLVMAKKVTWDQLDTKQQRNLTKWLNKVNTAKIVDSNWHFFRVLVNLCLALIDQEYNHELMKESLDRLEHFYLGGGWYADGPSMRKDFYIPFAFHFYGLIYARLAQHLDPARSTTFCQRAGEFSRDFVYWFTAEGSTIPFGRSLTYRFAQGAFWGALAFAGVESFTWGVIRGLAMRHLRWWSKQSITDHSGVLSIGYAYSNDNMAEAYNSPASPYWAFKFFLLLALEESHPFWQAPEESLPDLPGVHVQEHAGMIICSDAERRHVYALGNGQHTASQFATSIRHGAEKYAKFAYSSAFGFSIPSGQVWLEQAAPDSTLLLSDDNRRYRGREELIAASLVGNILHSFWQPWRDVSVETWLWPAPPWYIRVHRLKTRRSLYSVEGGFSIGLSAKDEAFDGGGVQVGRSFALAMSPCGWTGLRDLLGARQGQVIYAAPNTNLLYANTAIPLLQNRHRPGEHWLVCAVLGLPGTGAFDHIWATTPALPSLQALDRLGDDLHVHIAMGRVRLALRDRKQAAVHMAVRLGARRVKQRVTYVRTLLRGRRRH